MKEKHLLNITVPAKYTSRGREVTLWCEIERSADSVILQSDGNAKGTYPQLLPLLLRSDLEEAGVEAEADVPYEDCSAEVQALALRLDDPRIKWGHIYKGEREDVELWLEGKIDSPEDGRDYRKGMYKRDSQEQQNAFLRSKGYRWEKREQYFDCLEDWREDWHLINPEGEAVIGTDEVGIGCDTVVGHYGDIKKVLKELGYYGGEEKKPEKEAPYPVMEADEIEGTLELNPDSLLGRE